MKGWKTRTFPDKICIHHRAMNTAGQSLLKARFKLGAKDYSFGNHPLWELFRTFYQMRNSPFVLGGLALGAGYFWSMARSGGRISVARFGRIYPSRTAAATEEAREAAVYLQSSRGEMMKKCTLVENRRILGRTSVGGTL